MNGGNDPSMEDYVYNGYVYIPFRLLERIATVKRGLALAIERSEAFGRALSDAAFLPGTWRERWQASGVVAALRDCERFFGWSALALEHGLRSAERRVWEMDPDRYHGPPPAAVPLPEELRRVDGSPVTVGDTTGWPLRAHDHLETAVDQARGIRDAVLEELRVGPDGPDSGAGREFLGLTQAWFSAFRDLVVTNDFMGVNSDLQMELLRGPLGANRSEQEQRFGQGTADSWFPEQGG
jgi:hypothetical protein